MRLLVGLPTAVIAGPLYAKLIAPHVHLAADNADGREFVDQGAERSLPGFWLTLVTILSAGRADAGGELGRCDWLRREAGLNEVCT